MRVTPVSPALGVRVDDLGPLDVISTAEQDDLRALFDEHHLLLFRGREVGGPEQLALCRLLGDPIGHDPYWYAFTNESGVGGSGRLEFHSDYTYFQFPIEGICLNALALPERGTSKLYRNVERALETMPADLLAEVEDRWGLHVFDMANDDRREVPARRQRVGFVEPYAIHPFRKLNRRTGRYALCATDMHTELVVGMDRAESDALLDRVMAHLASPELGYEHRWELGDVVVWDNLALQHGRTDDVSQGIRRFRRVSFSDPEVAAATTEWEDVQGRSFGKQAISA